MASMEHMTYKEMQAYVQEMSKYKVKCKCGHVKTVLPEHINPKGYEICNWCGNRVYRDIEKQKRHDFKNEMRSRL